MGNPLLVLWHWIFVPRPGEDEAVDEQGPWRIVPGSEIPRPGTVAPPTASATSGAVFLVLRRMRVPLILLLLVFSISVLGLTLIPGAQPDGGTEPMGFFEAFYFMTYTATTIGFGEIPYEFTTAQRMWVTFSIYIAVIGWAYAIGSLLAMLQDRSFRREIVAQRFARQVRRMPEPFLVVIGYGEAGARVAHALDRRGRRLVVLDRSQERIDALELAQLRADVPALAANPRVPGTLVAAGLTHPRCEGVLALTDDDEANLAVVQAAHLLRPGVPVIARAETPATAARMAAFGQPTVVDPFDAFGDRLRLILRTPALAQLFDWLVSPPGAPVPPRPDPPGQGRWVVVGHSRTVAEVSADLRVAGAEVVELDPAREAGPEDGAFVDLVAGAVGVVAASDRDTQNLSYVEAAQRAEPDVFVVARQESPGNAPLFAALHPDLLLVPAEVVAREVLERLANPALWDLLQAAKGQGDPWAADALAWLVARCGPGSPTVWQVRLDARSAPALVHRLAVEPVRLGALMASPFGRQDPLPLTALMLVRGEDRVLVPDEETPLAVGDELLMAGGPGAQRGWDATLGEDDALAYVLSGSSVAISWWGRRLLRTRT
ncbi:MAG: potassium channel family protein [Candidatus Nanopelagicales bacterium]|jgi:Trk K+ transport system NAD-binding subunit|nr:potassium channel family protein [Candidatus Nanopelagicales bacterium]